MSTAVLLFVAMVALALYIPISRGKPKHICGMEIDRRVPFIPIFVLPYLALLAYVPASVYLLYSTANGKEFLIALAVVGVLYAVFAPFIGCGARRADARGKGVLRALVRFVYWADGKNNNDVFPSTHVYLATICSYYLAATFPMFALAIWSAGFFIAISTVFIKQHNVMDIAGGLVWATVAIMVARMVVPLIG